MVHYQEMLNLNTIPIVSTFQANHFLQAGDFESPIYKELAIFERVSSQRGYSITSHHQVMFHSCHQQNRKRPLMFTRKILQPHLQLVPVSVSSVAPVDVASPLTGGSHVYVPWNTCLYQASSYCCLIPPLMLQVRQLGFKTNNSTNMCRE